MRILGENLLDVLDDRLNGGDCGGELEQFRVIRRAGFHDPADNFGRQLRVLGNNVALRSIAALGARKAVFNTHGSRRFQFSRIRLPNSLVGLILSRDRSAGRGQCEPVREFPHQLPYFPANTVEFMTGDIVAVGIGRRTQHGHVFGGNMDRHLIKGGLHHPTGPTRRVCLAHLGITVRMRRRREQKR